MANRWGNNGNNERLYFLGLKIKADGDCSHEIKRYLLFGRKSMTNLDSILKSRGITLPTKVHIIKAMVFPVNWTIKKAEHGTIDAFELWCWRRLLRVPWTARRSSQSILKEINLEYSLEGLMLKPGGSVVKNPPANADDTGSTPGLGRSPGVGNGNSPQYSCLEKSMNRGAWWDTVHGVTKSQMLKLKLQNFGHLMPRTNSMEKTLKLGKTEGMTRRG